MIKAKSIYIHIPFCKSKCPYCDFASWAGKENLIEKYFDALIKEIRTKSEAYISLHNNEKKLANIKTIFIGGGTPSLIEPTFYKRLFDELKKYFILDNDCEITLELNPGSTREDYLKGYKKLGINRISIGAQSFNEEILKILGRKHSIEDTIKAINLTKDAGFENFSLDLIYNVPEMTKNIWEETINEVILLKPKHISAYSLIIEPNTPFENIYKDPNLLPTDDFSYELYLMLCNVLKKEGFIHYEISNFAKVGYESKHNLTYWHANEYFAFGISAHRFLNGLRTNNTGNLEEYINHPCIETIIDFKYDQKFEQLMLQSRLQKGFNKNLINKVSKKTNDELSVILGELSKNGLIELLEDNVSLTEKGMYLNNEILLRLM